MLLNVKRNVKEICKRVLLDIIIWINNRYNSLINRNNRTYRVGNWLIYKYKKEKL